MIYPKTREEIENLAMIAWRQREASIWHKAPYMRQAKEAWDLYFGRISPMMAIPNPVPVPVLEGYVKHMFAKIDDPPMIEYRHAHIADLKKAKKATALIQREIASKEKNALWPLKDRWAKKSAFFYSRGIYKTYAESDPTYKNYFGATEPSLFHAQPKGGGHLEMHLFCGEDGIVKTKTELIEGAKNGLYDRENTFDLVYAKAAETQESQDQSAAEDDSVEERMEALGLEMAASVYTGEPTVRLSEWYLEYGGERWYLLFDPVSRIWVRCERLTDMFSSGLFPYVTFSTDEDSQVFWNRAPVMPIVQTNKGINKLFNQELYNRDKQNMGERAYDINIFRDPAQLDDHRPDKLIPADPPAGKHVRDGIYQFSVNGLNQTLDFINWIDSYFGRQSGSTPGSQGVAEEGKKVGVYFGELQQVDEIVGTLNKSYREAWEEIGYRFIKNAADHLTEPVAIQLLGDSGVEEEEFGREDARTHRDLAVEIVGGSRDAAENERKARKQAAALASIESNQSQAMRINPDWSIEKKLKLGEFAEEEIRGAMDISLFGDQESKSEASQAVMKILRGGKPDLNKGADLAFMQYIIDFAHEKKMNERQFNVLLDYANAHAEIAFATELRKKREGLQLPALNTPGAPGPTLDLGAAHAERPGPSARKVAAEAYPR